MVNRREFFTRLSAAAVTAFAVTKLPVGWLPDAVTACGVPAYLTKKWNEHVKGSSYKNMPNMMYTSQELQDAFVEEIEPVQRFVWASEMNSPNRSMMFKMMRYKVDPTMKGWEVRFERV